MMSSGGPLINTDAHKSKHTLVPKSFDMEMSKGPDALRLRMDNFLKAHKARAQKIY